MASDNYITPVGLQRIQWELEWLRSVERPRIVNEVAYAASLGDRSENAEYLYRKKQLAEIDRRVRYLGKRIESLRVAGQRPTDARAIYFGAWLRIEAEDGREHHYRIVGPDEIDAGRGWISIDSPLARALLRRREDDEVEVELPAGKARFVVLAVSYDGPIGD